jgi:hypothetical protein
VSDSHRGPGRPPKNPQVQGEVIRRCDGCHFAAYKPALRHYACHRYPPVATPGGIFFPLVDADEWCGEWRPVKVAEVEKA